MKDVKARIEPGAFIRDKVVSGDNAVIMMGAIINIGAVIGEGSMIDMGAVLGGRATVGKNCHIGAGTVLAGVIEPPSAQPVIVEDDVVIGANAVVLEGCRIGFVYAQAFCLRVFIWVRRRRICVLDASCVEAFHAPKLLMPC